MKKDRLRIYRMMQSMFGFLGWITIVVSFQSVALLELCVVVADASNE
jgi:hypothetical protein